MHLLALYPLQMVLLSPQDNIYFTLKSHQPELLNPGCLGRLGYSDTPETSILCYQSTNLAPRCGRADRPSVFSGLRTWVGRRVGVRLSGPELWLGSGELLLEQRSSCNPLGAVSSWQNKSRSHRKRPRQEGRRGLEQAEVGRSPRHQASGRLGPKDE